MPYFFIAETFFQFCLYTCQDSVQGLYCSTVSRIMHVNTGGEFAADSNINMLTAASRVLFTQDEF